MSEVARLRRYTGKTQKEMAEMFGISLQAYSRKERGLTPYSDTEKIMLKEFFSKDFPGITIDHIFFSQSVPKVEKRSD